MMDEKEKMEKEQSFEFERVFHENYENRKIEKMNVFIAFLGAMLALFYGWGYVFVNSPINNVELVLDVRFDSLIYHLITIVASGMLVFFHCLCIYFGYEARMGQVVAQRTMEINIQNNHYKEIFGDSFYNAYNKDWWSYIQDFYNWFCLLFVACMLFILFVTFLFKISCCCQSISIVLQVLFLISTIIVRLHYYEKYIKNIKNL